MGGIHSRLVLALLLAAFAGCANDPTGPLSQEPPKGADQDRLAAHAAETRFPAQALPSDELKVTAVVDRSDRTIALRNFGDQAIKDVDVWVDGTYVRRIPTLPAREGVVVHFAQFYDAHGRSLATRNGAIARIQLAIGDRLFNTIGPAVE